MESHASSGHLSVLHPTPSFLGPEDKRKVFRTPDVDVVYQRDNSYCHGLCSYSAASSHRLEIKITPVSEVLAFWHFWIGYLYYCDFHPSAAMAHTRTRHHVVERHRSIMVHGRTCLGYRMFLPPDLQTSSQQSQELDSVSQIWRKHTQSARCGYR
ncbi:hypothetical protein QX201_012172 [Fusarium graminearum]